MRRLSPLFCQSLLLHTHTHAHTLSGVHAALKLTGDSTGQAVEHIGRLQAPLMLLQAGNDPDLKGAVEAMKLHPTLADKMVARTFWDVDHGWAAARGDWSNPRIRAGV